MDWPIPYLFKRYDIATFNCWHLVCQVYQDQLGITLDAYNGINPRDPLAVGKQVDLTFSSWLQCGPGVALAIAAMARGKTMFHVGVVVAPDQILHVVEGANACVQSPAYLATQGFKRITYYRHAKNLPCS